MVVFGFVGCGGVCSCGEDCVDYVVDWDDV